MPRSRSPERQRELDELRDLLLVFAEFLRAIFSGDLVRAMVDGVEKAYQRGSAPGLRMARNDMVEMTTQSCSPKQLRQLDRLLRSHTNTSVEELLAKRTFRVQKIRERGRILSDEQYYLLREYVEFIAGDPSRVDEARDLVTLLNTYEERLSLSKPQ